jgi:AraC-like DNA-binding protein
MPLTPAGTPEEFIRSAVGHYYAGRSFVSWNYDERLDGVHMWGRPDPDSLRLFVRFLEIGARSGPHHTLIDLRGVTGVDFESFDILLEGVRAKEPVFASNVLKQAILRPEGAIGAVVLGFYGLLQVRYPVKHFTELMDALAWFDRPDRERIAADLEAMHAKAFGRPELVMRLRTVLEAREGRGSPGEIAKALGLSPRTLQRRLAEHGTSLREETHACRVERAKTLLAETDGRLLVIATKVGFDSERTFTEVFRRRTGTTPQRWREEISRGSCRSSRRDPGS